MYIRSDDMPRPKGSKNKAKSEVKNTSVDLDALIEEKKAASSLLEEEISSIGVKIEELKAEKKEKSASLKDLAKEIAKLEEKKAKEEEAKAEEQRKADLENVLSNLLSSGMSFEAILEKLK